jgi:hypothetical protein
LNKYKKAKMRAKRNVVKKGNLDDLKDTLARGKSALDSLNVRKIIISIVLCFQTYK